MTAYTQVSANRFKTWLIMFLFAAFITFVVFIFTQALGYHGPSALGFTGIALIIAGIMNFFAYYSSDKLVMTISGAKQIQKKDNPTLFRVVENLCIASGLPMPKIYLINDTAPNAFATGRNPKHASICFTTGILQKLDKLELEGVAAHELSHVGNYDTRLMSIVSVLVGLIALLADWFIRILWWGGGGSRDDDNRGAGGAIIMVAALVLAILSPIIAMLIQLAISRKREFMADASGALITRNPDSLASALLKISKDTEPLEAANKATAHLYIVNPLKGRKDAIGWFAGLFNTHPPIEKRVKALQAMQ
ncbi:zinc metalloprotease HtpX [Candidatus Curtissbacteria bacterium RIFCSPLOWO2_01_FULL_42_26]|uniref:Protease HtpX homolog n=1 Tax=Candidatus Curtissbacteria bacterium RIFCSPLOWO2_01_FULL_42_26 TaxID=1797729 RepID=A0A1F5I3B8_9BACT|nr:MAG: zinc metalloprotease HtpX [Candidatus Curtissbacteria bacterium RIFCSPLOWO2_01_FULL_42_26]